MSTLDSLSWVIPAIAIGAVLIVVAVVGLVIWASMRAGRTVSDAVNTHMSGAWTQGLGTQSAYSVAVTNQALGAYGAASGFDVASYLRHFARQWSEVGQATMPPSIVTSAIKSHDPDFSVEGFLDRVGRVFFVVNEAFTDADPSRLRGVAGESVGRQWTTEIEDRRARGARNVREQAVLANTWILGAEHTQSLDAIQVKIRAAMADYDVDAAGNVTTGERTVRTYTEDWTFTRRGDATTGGRVGTRNCHNCGAPFDGDLAGVCRYCSTPQVDLGDDWLLFRVGGRRYVP